MFGKSHVAGSDPSQPPVVYRPPILADGSQIHSLVREVGALDLNSTYSYLLLATHFAETCAVATRGRRLIGFASGYLEPTAPSVLFIWQVAVRQDAQGHGVARHLLRHILDRPTCARVRFLEATVTPSNDASFRLFQRVACDSGAAFDRRRGFAAGEFGHEDHEPEELVRIGPFDKQGSVQ